MTVAPREAGTAPVRVQVIDLTPRVLDLVVPTYLPAADLTTRIARDAGLGAWWPDGSRRTFGLLARGRLLRDDERLADVGVVPWELIHLLPDPAPGSPVRERDAGLAAALPPARSVLNRVASVLRVLAWTAIAAVGLRALPMPGVAFLGAFGSAWLTALAVRRPGGSIALWDALAGAVLGVPMLAVLGAVAWTSGVDAVAIHHAAAGASLRLLVLTGLGGGVGALLGGLTLLGPFDPLTAEAASTATEASQSGRACALCGGAVSIDVAEGCGYGCDRVFHRGCLAARRAVATGTGCEVCGVAVPGR